MPNGIDMKSKKQLRREAIEREQQRRYQEALDACPISREAYEKLVEHVSDQVVEHGHSSGWEETVSYLQSQSHPVAAMLDFVDAGNQDVDPGIAHVYRRSAGGWELETVIDEPDTFGFTYATLPGHPERGHESFTIRQTPQGTRFEIDVSWSQLPDLYREMGVFAMPAKSRWGGLEVEGLGIVYLEAAAAAAFVFLDSLPWRLVLLLFLRHDKKAVTNATLSEK